MVTQSMTQSAPVVARVPICGILSLAAPFIGALCLYVSFVTSHRLMTDRQISVYRAQIEVARQNGKEVHDRNVQISLGPPITAHFVQRTMMWFAKEVVYDESEALARAEHLNIGCHQIAQPLGGHFYIISGTC